MAIEFLARDMLGEGFRVRLSGRGLQGGRSDIESG